MSRLDFLLGAMDLMGISIIETPLLEPKPKLKLSPACPVSDEFRQEMDAWLLEMFGTEAPEVYQSSLGVHVGPSLAKALRGVVKTQVES